MQKWSFEPTSGYKGTWKESAKSSLYLITFSGLYLIPFPPNVTYSDTIFDTENYINFKTNVLLAERHRCSTMPRPKQWKPPVISRCGTHVEWPSKNTIASTEQLIKRCVTKKVIFFEPEGLQRKSNIGLVEMSEREKFTNLFVSKLFFVDLDR